MNTTLICIVQRQDEKKIPRKTFLKTVSSPQRYIHINSYPNCIAICLASQPIWIDFQPARGSSLHPYCLYDAVHYCVLSLCWVVHSGCLMWEVRGRRGRNGSTALRTWPPLSSVWLWVDTTRCSMKTRPRWALNTHSHTETQTRTSVLMLWHAQTQLRTLSVCVSYTRKCANLTH